MKFFMDQDVYAATVRFLRELGHDVITAYEAGMPRSDDRVLLEEAEKLNRIFVTRDRDFGSLVFVEKLGSGVIYLRIRPSTVEAVHNTLAQIIRAYSEKELNGAFVVVEPGRYRFRKLRADE